MENRRIIAPGVVKILLGASLAFLIYKTMPVVELLNLFFGIVLVPLALLLGLGLIGNGTYDMVAQATMGWTERAKHRFDQYLQDLREGRPVYIHEPAPAPAQQPQPTT